VEPATRRPESGDRTWREQPRDLVTASDAIAGSNQRIWCERFLDLV
jgi:hypothetical protein